MKTILRLLLLISLIGCKKKSVDNLPAPDPPTSMDSVLAKGVNLSNWFNDYSDPNQFSNRFPLSTLQLIKSGGFTYVRIPIGITILFNAANPAQLNPTNLSYVDAAVDNCIKAGLGVAINLHAWQNDADIQLASDPSFDDKIAAYWKAIANYFKKYSAEKILFEVYKFHLSKQFNFMPTDIIKLF